MCYKYWKQNRNESGLTDFEGRTRKNTKTKVEEEVDQEKRTFWNSCKIAEEINISITPP